VVFAQRRVNNTFQQYVTKLHYSASDLLATDDGMEVYIIWLNESTD